MSGDFRKKLIIYEEKPWEKWKMKNLVNEEKKEQEKSSKKKISGVQSAKQEIFSKNFNTRSKKLQVRSWRFNWNSS